MVLIPATMIKNEIHGLLHTVQDLHLLQVVTLTGIGIPEDGMMDVGEDFDYKGNLNQ